MYIPAEKGKLLAYTLGGAKSLVRSLKRNRNSGKVASNVTR
jgi:hypothetical protein